MVTAEPLLLATVLHDAVEDTETTFEELAQHFGFAGARLVRELTDRKALAKSERKRQQIEHASDPWRRAVTRASTASSSGLDRIRGRCARATLGQGIDDAALLLTLIR